MRAAMLKFCVGVCALFFVLFSAAQSSHFPTPPEPLDKQPQPREQLPTPTRRVTPAQLQKDADDLARMAQTIPVDVASVRRGMFPRM